MLTAVAAPASPRGGDCRLLETNAVLLADVDIDTEAPLRRKNLQKCVARERESRCAHYPVHGGCLH